MIKNIIFDFGDIFINLDKTATPREMSKFGFTKMTPQIEEIAQSYEKGLMSSKDFISKMSSIFPNATNNELLYAWNAILLDFPEYRLEFLEALVKGNKYRLFLLSNTNEIHIDEVIRKIGAEKFNRFKNCFEQFYLSHEIHFRKPNADIYEFVLNTNNLIAAETFFIDDTKENTDTAEKLGIKCWNLQVGKEDIINLKNKIN